MRIEREDTTISEAAARENVHYSLNNVRVEPGKLVSCEGHILSIREVQMEEEEESFEPFMLDKQAFKDATKKGGFLRRGENGKASFQDFRGETESSIPKQECTYPDYERVIPKSEEGEGKTVLLDVTYLTRLLKTFKGVERISFTILDEKKAVLLEGRTEGFRKVTGIIMPIVS